MALNIPSPDFLARGVTPPDILGEQQKAATLSQMLNANALQKQLAPLQVQEAQQKVQQETMANEIQRIQLEGQKSLQKWLQEGDTNEDIPADQFKLNDKIATFVGVDPKDPIMQVVRSMAQHGVPAPMLMTEAQGMLQRRNEYNKGTEEQQKIIKENYDTWKDAMGTIFKADPSNYGLLTAQALPRLAAATHLSPELDAMVNLLRQNPQMGVPIAYNLVAAQEKTLGLRKSAAEAKVAEQKVIPEGGGLSPEVQQQVQKDIAVATNPQIQAGKVAVAEAEGRARALVEQQIARGSNAALANVPQHLIAPATEAATKAGTEYAQAKSVSDRLTAVMDAAKRGNVVSYQLIPQEGALQLTTSQGVHRINMAEIQNYGGGSLWQKMEGHLGKALTGKSIPDSVLGDMAEMQKFMAQGSESKYNNTLKTINQTYGANFQPVEMSGLGGNAGPKAGIIEDGYRFKGGDASKPENWEKVKK